MLKEQNGLSVWQTLASGSEQHHAIGALHNSASASLVPGEYWLLPQPPALPSVQLAARTPRRR